MNNCVEPAMMLGCLMASFNCPVSLLGKLQLKAKIVRRRAPEAASYTRTSHRNWLRLINLIVSFFTFHNISDGTHFERMACRALRSSVVSVHMLEQPLISEL